MCATARFASNARCNRRRQLASWAAGARIHGSRWIECASIRKANAQTIRKELNERVFLRFGLPETFDSDNGTEFKNRVLDKFLEERGVVHTTNLSYHAQANPVERLNFTMQTMIRSYLEDNHRDWDLHVLEPTYTYNTAVQANSCG